MLIVVEALEVAEVDTVTVMLLLPDVDIVPESVLLAVVEAVVVILRLCDDVAELVGVFDTEVLAVDEIVDTIVDETEEESEVDADMLPVEVSLLVPDNDLDVVAVVDLETDSVVDTVLATVSLMVVLAVVLTEILAVVDADDVPELLCEVVMVVDLVEV